MFSTRIANTTVQPDQLPPPSDATLRAIVAEPGIDREYVGRWPEPQPRVQVPWPFRAQGEETRTPVRFIGYTLRVSEGQSMATRQPFTGAHAVIGRNPTGFPVGAWAGGSQPNRLVFRRIPEAWDAGSEHG